MSSGTLRDKQFNSFVKSPLRGEPFHARETVTSLSDGTLNPFGELKVAQKNTLFNVKTTAPSISRVRNAIETDGNGIVDKTLEEFFVETTANGSDRAKLETAARGTYQSGHMAEAGIGVRIPDQTFTGSQVARWGYFEGDEGYIFGKDAGGIFVAIRRKGVTTKIYQQNWNTERLDGTDDSDLTLDLARGNIFEIQFAWYGYGVVQFIVNIIDPLVVGGQRPIIIHRYFTNQETSIAQPNLKISAEVENNGTASPIKMFVGGRQFSIYGGEPKTARRITGTFRGATDIVTTEFRPLISLRRKTGVSNLAQAVRIGDSFLIGDVTTVIGFVIDGTLTGASFGNPIGHDPNETCLEADISATAITGGYSIGPYFLLNANNKVGGQIQSEVGQDFDFIENQAVTIVAKAISNNGLISAAAFNAAEEW